MTAWRLLHENVLFLSMNNTTQKTCSVDYILKIYSKFHAITKLDSNSGISWAKIALASIHFRTQHKTPIKIQLRSRLNIAMKKDQKLVTLETWAVPTKWTAQDPPSADEPHSNDTTFFNNSSGKTLGLRLGLLPEACHLHRRPILMKKRMTSPAPLPAAEAAKIGGEFGGGAEGRGTMGSGVGVLWEDSGKICGGGNWSAGGRWAILWRWGEGETGERVQISGPPGIFPIKLIDYNFKICISIRERKKSSLSKEIYQFHKNSLENTTSFRNNLPGTIFLKAILSH